MISDVSDYQARRESAEPRVLSSLFWKDGAVAQMTERVMIDGRPYLIFADEAGAGGIGEGARSACAQNLPPFGFARIIDISDEKNPRIVSQLMLEVHDPANCAAVQPDTGFTDLFGYSSHYCTTDNAAERGVSGVQLFRSGRARLRHPRSVPPEGNRVLQAARPLGDAPRLLELVHQTPREPVS